MDLISQNRPAETGKSFYHTDGLGSTRSLTDAGGASTDRYDYDAFGQQLGDQQTILNPYRFAGELQDQDTGLVYLRARHFAPRTGRFLGMDPVEGKLGVPTSLNEYVYAAANPVNRIDPSGGFTLSEVMIAQELHFNLQSSFAQAGLKGIKRTQQVVNQILVPAVRIKRVGIAMLVSDTFPPGRPDGFEMYQIGRYLESRAYLAEVGALIAIYQEFAEGLAKGALVGFFASGFWSHVYPEMLPSMSPVDEQLDELIHQLHDWLRSEGLADFVRTGEGDLGADRVLDAADRLLWLLGVFADY